MTWCFSAAGVTGEMLSGKHSPVHRVYIPHLEAKNGSSARIAGPLNERRLPQIIGTSAVSTPPHLPFADVRSTARSERIRKYDDHYTQRADLIHLYPAYKVAPIPPANLFPRAGQRAATLFRRMV